MSMRFGNLALMLAVFCVLMACESSGTTTQHQTDGDVIADNDKEAATDGDTDKGSEEENTDLGETEDISEAEESAPDGDAPTENEVEPETPVDGDEDSTESADDTDVTGDNPESETTDDAENPDGDQVETDGPPPCPAWDGKPDLPDPEYIDNDCDGIDGSKENAIFVDPVNGSNMYSGSFGFPVEDMEKRWNWRRKKVRPKQFTPQSATTREPFIWPTASAFTADFFPIKAGRGARNTAICWSQRLRNPATFAPSRPRIVSARRNSPSSAFAWAAFP